MIEPGDESVRREDTPGFAESVSFAWGEPAAGWYGTVRVGLASGTPASASGLGLLFRGPEVAAAGVAAGEPVEDPDWRKLAVGDGAASVEVIEPLTTWRAQLDAEGGGFDLAFTALSPAAELGAGADREGGYQYLCAVEGEVRDGTRRERVSCLGQRTRRWGAVDWERTELTRQVSAWLSPGHAVMLNAARGRPARGHEDEEVSAWLLDTVDGGDGGDDAIRLDAVTEPRLSSVFDGAGRQIRAGVELWVGEEDGFPRRAAGEALCGTSLELGRLQLDTSFFRWRMEGLTGVGQYDVLRRR